MYLVNNFFCLFVFNLIGKVMLNFLVYCEFDLWFFFLILFYNFFWLFVYFGVFFGVKIKFFGIIECV